MTKEYKVNSDSMAALISTSICTLGSLDLFRGRQDTVLVIDFDEYLKYIKNYVLPNKDDSSNIYDVARSFNLTAEQLIQSNNQLLYELIFRLDVAQAILKDISLTAFHQRNPSKIGWSASNCAEYSAMPGADKQLCLKYGDDFMAFMKNHLTNKGYTLPSNASNNLQAYANARELMQSCCIIRTGKYVPLWRYGNEGE